MDTAAQPTLERTEKSFGSYIESLTRLTAASLALMYGIGFFILSLHEARFGILQFSPLRARILFVGFTFMLLAALPIAANKYKIAYFGPVKPVLENTDPLLSGQRGMFLKSAFVYTAILIAMLVHPFLFVNVSLSKPPLGRWSWLLVVIFLAGIWAVTRIWSYLARDFVSRPTRAAVLSLLASGAVLGGIYLLYSGVASLALWMFVVVFVVGDPQDIEDKLRYALDFRTWLWIVAILGFYVHLFGSMEAKYGGGAATPVTLYLSKAVAWLPPSPANVSLIDETDQGYYILTSDKDKALFIPRSDVDSVYFGSVESPQKTK